MKRSGKTIAFSEALDRKLIKLVGIYGTNNWNMISRNFTEKSAKKCKDRWRYFLAPSNEPAPWTQEEDDLLLSLESQLGTKWTSISERFFRRTPCDVRTRFLKLKRQQRKFMKMNNRLNKTTIDAPEHEQREEEPIKTTDQEIKEPQIKALSGEESQEEESSSKDLIDKIFDPYCEDFIIEFSGLLSFEENFD